MEDEVGGPLISTHFLDLATHFLDVSSYSTQLGNAGLVSDLSSNSILKTDTEIVTEAGDALKSGVLIETSKGLEWLNHTDALTSGVGGLNLCVEDFQNVAAELLLPEVSVSTVEEEREESSAQGIGSERDPSTSVESEQAVQCFGLINSKLESIAEATEHCEGTRIEVFRPVDLTKGLNLSLKNRIILKKKIKLLKSSDSSSLTVSESTGTNSDSSVQSAPQIQVRRKGGWPKGRKRKPELTNRPPKAPCTGYVYYLNEKRKRPEFRNIPFPEVTKILGNEWSSLSLENKKEYLERAELDKKRYREELKIYRNSDTYRSYLKRRRIKSFKSNGTEESDFDATDEIDDEDNMELYCRACDQWFTTLHNKKEHLYGKQHFQAIQKENRSLSLDESSVDGTPLSSLGGASSLELLPSVPDAMTNFMCKVLDRDREIKLLQERQKMLMVKNKQILKELQELKQAQVKLQKLSSRQKEEQNQLEKAIYDLWDVPSLLYQKPNLILSC